MTIKLTKTFKKPVKLKYSSLLKQISKASPYTQINNSFHSFKASLLKDIPST